jgi:hypothetical protein
VRAFAICGLLGCLATDGSAQDRAGSVYVSAGASVPHQAEPGGVTVPPFAAAGGSTVRWLVGGGVFVSPRLSIEGDVSGTGVMESTQSGRGFEESSERRERVVSLGLKHHLPLGSVVRVAPVAGVVLVDGRVSFQGSRFVTRPSGTGFITERVPTEQGHVDFDWNVGVMFGVDVRIGGERFAIVPGVRLAFTGVPDGSRCVIGFAGDTICSPREKAYFSGYYPRWTERPSVSLAVSF